MTGQDGVERITCLGCGCGCDDISVTVREGRILGTETSCLLEKAWLGDGAVPWEVRVGGQPATLDDAIAEAATLLGEARGRTLVQLGVDISSQAQRQAVTLADILNAHLDTATSATAAAGLLAAQRRGRATATLGEVRNRADVVLFWGVDPRQRYPRYLSRYAPEPAGTHIPEGRSGRFVISVSIGLDKGPPDADLTVSLGPEEETAALSLMRASLASAEPEGEFSPGLRQALALVPRLTGARYAVIVHDAEPSAQERNPRRVEGLIAFTQALNGPTRAALSSLRAGGNQVGADSVLTWQTGYPFAVDYTRGYPRYAPGERGLHHLLAGGLSAVLLVGAPALREDASAALARIKSVVIGPRATESTFNPRVAIDTGVAGIHEGGTAYRMDEVPLPLHPPLAAKRTTTETLAALIGSVRARRGGKRP